MRLRVHTIIVASHVFFPKWDTFLWLFNGHVLYFLFFWSRMSSTIAPTNSIIFLHKFITKMPCAQLLCVLHSCVLVRPISAGLIWSHPEHHPRCFLSASMLFTVEEVAFFFLVDGMTWHDSFFLPAWEALCVADHAIHSGWLLPLVVAPAEIGFSHSFSIIAVDLLCALQ